MATRLGNYTIVPELTGTIFVKHDSKSLTKSYENEILFMHELQKHDWPVFHQAVKDVLETLYQVYKGHYFQKNREYQSEVLSRITKDFYSLKTMPPAEIGTTANYIIDIAPLFARTNQVKYDNCIKENAQIISDYYKRHLKKYGNYNNSFLTV